MRVLAYGCVGVLLVLLQGIFGRLLSPFSDAVWFGVEVQAYLHGATPNLVLPIVVYLGLHEPSMARGAVLAFVLGFCLDVLGGGPGFLYRFVMVAIWSLSRALASRVSAQSVMTRIPIALVASLLESLLVLTLLAIFGTDNRRPLELSTVVLPRAIATAVFSPLLFRLAQRLAADSKPAVPPAASQLGA